MTKYLNHFVNDIFNIQYTPYFYIISTLFILFPITLVTGPFLPDAFLTLIGLYFLVVSLQKKLFSYYKNIFIYFFASFYLLILISGLLSEDIYSSLIDSNGPIFYFRYLFYILGVKYLLDINPKLISYFTIILFLTILIAIIDGMIQWQTGYNILGFPYDPNHGTRITGLFRDEQILGHFLAYVVPLCFGLLLFLLKNSYSKKLLILGLFIFLILSEVFIFITNDRSAFLRIVQFTLLLIFLSNNYKFFRLISFLISLIFITLLLNFSSHSSYRYIENTIKDVSSTKIPYMPWTPVHEAHFKITIDFFTEKPLIGNGPQYFRYKCDEIKIEGCTSHPHNYYFQTLAELGIIGLSFLFFGFLYLTYILFRQFLNVWFLKNSKYHIPDYLISFYSLAFLFIWPLIPNGSFYNNWLNAMIFLPIPFILYFQNKWNNRK